MKPKKVFYTNVTEQKERTDEGSNGNLLHLFASLMIFIDQE